MIPKVPVFHHFTDSKEAAYMFSHPESIKGREVGRSGFDGVPVHILKGIFAK
jgi:hypothetical protein